MPPKKGSAPPHNSEEDTEDTVEMETGNEGENRGEGSGPPQADTSGTQAGTGTGLAPNGSQVAKTTPATKGEGKQSRKRKAVDTPSQPSAFNIALKTAELNARTETVQAQLASEMSANEDLRATLNEFEEASQEATQELDRLRAEAVERERANATALALLREEVARATQANSNNRLAELRQRIRYDKIPYEAFNDVFNELNALLWDNTRHRLVTALKGDQLKPEIKNKLHLYTTKLLTNYTYRRSSPTNLDPNLYVEEVGTPGIKDDGEGGGRRAGPLNSTTIPTSPLNLRPIKRIASSATTNSQERSRTTSRRAHNAEVEPTMEDDPGEGTSRGNFRHLRICNRGSGCEFGKSCWNVHASEGITFNTTHIASDTNFPIPSGVEKGRPRVREREGDQEGQKEQVKVSQVEEEADEEQVQVSEEIRQEGLRQEELKKLEEEAGRQLVRGQRGGNNEGAVGEEESAKEEISNKGGKVVNGSEINIFYNINTTTFSRPGSADNLETMNDLIDKGDGVNPNTETTIDTVADISVDPNVDMTNLSSRRVGADHANNKADGSYRVNNSQYKRRNLNRFNKCRKYKTPSGDLKIISANVRSIRNKVTSITNILSAQNVDIAIFSELNIKQKMPRIKGFNAFYRLSKRKFHGLGIYIANHLSNSIVRVPEENEELEIVHILLKHTTPNISILGCYLDVESRSDNDKTSRTWQKLVTKIDMAISRGEGVVVMGDLNRPLQKIRPSFGTKLLLQWAESGVVTILNDTKINTRIDPRTGNGSVLDLGIVSSNLCKTVTSFKVDSQREWSPFSMTKKVNGMIVKKISDHLAICLELKVPITIRPKVKAKAVVNFRNPEGWVKYKRLSDEIAPEIRDIASDVTLSINEVRAKIHVANLKAQVDSFGVTWVKPKSKSKKKVRKLKDSNELFLEQCAELDEMIEQGRSHKDINSKVYKLKEFVCGPKLKPAEPACINDPITEELITNFDEIKRVSLEHCTNILLKNTIRDCDKEELQEKEKAHKIIMNTDTKDEYELEPSLYHSVLKRISKKGKRMFDLLNKAGDDYKEAIFLYMKRIFKYEETPYAFSITWLIAIWKKKGSALDLNMMRYIHTKMWEAKLCEALVTEHMKPKIIRACPNIQIGGMPGSSSTEHLVTVKTWMLKLEEMNLNGIFQTFDLSKFFDKESLIDVMQTLKIKAGICDKDYRLWVKLNENANIGVKTSVGDSKTKLVKNSVGQGSFGAALASSINIGCAIEETFRNKTSARIGHLDLNCVIMQDDIAKMNSKLAEARQGCELIDNTLKRKQLSVNHDKSKYLIMGSKKFRKDTLKELETNPMTMGGVTIDHAEAEKYLGDWVSELGCRESIYLTIKERIRKLISKGDELIQIAEAPVMGATGNSLTAIKLFESQIIPGLLFNSESWIGITQAHIQDLQNFQDKFLRKLMRLPPTTPKAVIHWDGGMESMKWRIALKKLLFVRKTMLREDDNICKQALINECGLNIKGLGHECLELTNILGLPDIRFTLTRKGDIKRAVKKQSLAEKRLAMEESRKVGDRLSDDPIDNNYLAFMTLPNSRIWMRYRARAIKGVKMNCKNSHRDLSCRFCQDGDRESQEHLINCTGCTFERRNLDTNNWRGMVIFWRRMTAKYEAVGDRGEETGEVAADT